MEEIKHFIPHYHVLGERPGPIEDAHDKYFNPLQDKSDAILDALWEDTKGNPPEALYILSSAIKTILIQIRESGNKGFDIIEYQVTSANRALLMMEAWRESGVDNLGCLQSLVEGLLALVAGFLLVRHGVSTEEASRRGN